MGLFSIEENNVQTVKDLSDAAWDRIIEQWGLHGEGWAVEEVDRAVYDTPESPNYIRTGDLRKSITHIPGGIFEDGERAAVIGSDMEYAPYVELGTSKMPPRPFIRPAVEKHMADYAQIMMEEMENG